MKFKKSIISLASLTAVVAPVATVVACGSSEGGSGFKYDAAKSEVYLALDGDDHSENDHSFNEQAFNGIKAAGFANPKVVKPAAPNQDQEFQTMYSNIDKGNIIVAPGYKHGSPLEKSVEQIGGKAVVLLDSTVVKRNIVTAKYKVEQAAYLAGYSFAKQFANTADKPALDALIAKYDINNDHVIKVSTFGGAAFDTVTGFMAGFKTGFVKGLEGARTEVSQAVSFFEFGTAGEHFSGGFAPGGADAVAAKLQGQGVDVVLPVAGPQTKDALKYMNAIGVDTPQETLYTQEPHKVIFSVLKNIQDSTVQALNFITGKAVDAKYQVGDKDAFTYNHLTVGTLENQLVGVSSADAGVDAIYKTVNVKGNAIYDLAAAQDTDWDKAFAVK